MNIKRRCKSKKLISNIKQTERLTYKSVSITLIDVGYNYFMMKMFDLADENLSTDLNTLLRIKGTDN